MQKIGPIGVVLSALLASTAHAQTPVNAPDDVAETEFGEIIVTAQRKEEKLQDTPLAITAVTAESAARFGLIDAVDIGKITPGVSFTTTNGFFSTRIRGIGVDFVSVGVESPVAVYEDGAYLTRTLTVNEILDNFDIASIQVLRGPQGTLYGRNATGGVVIVNSADPTDELSGKVRAEIGNIDHRQIAAMINLPLGENLALRATGGYKHDGGYVRELATGRDVGGGRTYNGRVKLRWNPTGADIVLGAQYYDVAYSLGPLSADGDSGDACYACSFPGSGVSAAPIGFFETNSVTTIQPVRTKYYGANLKMMFEIGQFDLTSTTTFRKQKTTDSAADQDFTQLPIFEFAVPASGGRTYTQDVQVASKFDGELNVLAGASYLNDRGYFNPAFLGAAFGNPTMDLATAGSFKNSATTKSFAVFLEGYYELSDQLKVTVGGRYTWERRGAHGDLSDALAAAFGVPGGQGFAFDLPTSKQNAFTPRFVLAWDNGPTNVYYSFTRGFKAGGFPAPFPFPVSAVLPEKAFNHEVGVKHSMFDNRVRLNAAAFYLKNKNLQVQTLDVSAGGAVTKNAGALENYGIELEVQATPMTGLNLGFSGAWQHARYADYRDASLACYDPAGLSNPTAPGAKLYPCNLDVTGTAPPGAPDWTASFNAAYEFPLGDWTGSLAGLVQYRSKINFTPGRGGERQFDFDNERWLVNASGFISPPGDRFRVGFYVNNVFNTKILAFRQTSQPWGVIKNAGRPRTIGARLEVSF